VFLQGYPPELAGDCAHATAWMLNNGTDMPLGSPACGNCKNVDCTSAPKCFEYGGYDFGNCTYKNDIPKAIKLGKKSATSFHVFWSKRSFLPRQAQAQGKTQKANCFTGLTDENAVNTAVRRVLWNIFTAGIYDKVSETMPWCGTRVPSGQNEHVLLLSSFFRNENDHSAKTGSGQKKKEAQR
jgi:hypothetical protein